ncbi:MAG TPA: LysR substrate-binding domain-containing protein [Steroidobacteraceae bacterium]|jgi:LysR family hydrogen peroxide-inducible transcriptional activator|nr:LysR substrate-binding domain-containing protein [Steroidobacteraceae bacterium]
MSDLKLKDLRYLVAVADTLHFGRAAAKCFVSQPTLSAQLRKLEEYLGVQLIERQPRRIALTEAGQEIARRARTMLESSEAILTMAQTRRDPLAGQLRLALLPTIGPYLLPQVALKMQKALPRLELMLYEYQTEPMLEHLQQGAIDVGILALPVHVEGVVTRELYEEPFVAAVPAQHRLAGRSRVRTEDLQGETLLLLEDGHCLRDQALAVCARSGVHEKQDFRATSIETLRQMVATGAGVTLLPELASVGAYSAIKGLSIVPFSKPVPTRTIGAVWRKSTARAAAIDAVCEQLQRHSGLPA